MNADRTEPLQQSERCSVQIWIFCSKIRDCD